VQAYAVEADQDLFDASRRLFATTLDWLCGETSADLDHAGLEARIAVRLRDVARQVLQDHLDLRAQREERLSEVVDADGVARSRAQAGRDRGLATIFGEVVVGRIGYREWGYPDLYPADAALNLPAEKHSHGLRRLAAVEATRGSFAQAVAAIARATGVSVGKRQVEALTVRAAADVEAFYAQRRPDPVGRGLMLGMSADAKGVVMRTEALREATAKAQTSRKLSARHRPGRNAAANAWPRS
jgi:hypothetical protein